MRLAVSGAQPLFTLGLLTFALSLVDFLSLLLSPSTDIKISYFCQKYHLKDTYKIFKKFNVGLKFEWGLLDQYWLSCEGLPFEDFFSCLYDGLLCKHAGDDPVTTEAWSSPHLTCQVCVVWLPESLMGLSALCILSVNFPSPVAKMPGSVNMDHLRLRKACWELWLSDDQPHSD